ncbi:peptidoglycan-binding protein [Gracilibacillus salinarum]|uniref:Peptidoglycan-binding protein n=1 Tax=Gracilibacillus salinarum TaxID=2932255 RepID=A0ABY4GSC4_9BACI|nr:peptidoglycan-binding protein [Gracilibacillus salinarum]UOQ87045.1 peptidoglycan-binding protein [Gracilibacillus salinarum]
MIKMSGKIPCFIVLLVVTIPISVFAADANESSNHTYAVSTESVELSIGDSSELVLELKKQLAIIGFKVSNHPNQDYGPKTASMVRSFQKYYGLEETGVASEDTFKKIDTILSSPLQVGKSNQATLELKTDLEKIGFTVSDTPNQDYGPKTARTVEAFQKKYGLTVNGIGDEITLNKIQEVLEMPMQNGLYRQDVLELKVKLAKLGFEVSENPTPQFGPKTEATVKQFQSYYGLNVTGVVGEATLLKVDKILASPLQLGNSNPETLHLKQDLEKLGFIVSDSPNEDFGRKTAITVEAFQAKYGLTVNGIADEVTLAKIQEVLEMPMQYGLYRQDVLEMKLQLAKFGFEVSNNPTPQFGPKTEDTVKEFQQYYGLDADGVVGKETLDKINEMNNSQYQPWNSSNQILAFKKDLAKIGFVVSDQPNNDYGRKTAEIVKEFQQKYGLVVNGIGDEVTRTKVQEVLEMPMQYGLYRQDVKEMKIKIAKLGFVVSNNPTPQFGAKTEIVVKQFQRYYGLSATGIMDDKTLNKINDNYGTILQYGNSHNQVLDMKQDLAKLGFKITSNPSTYFGPKTENLVEEFQQYYGLKVNGIVDDVTLNKIHSILSSDIMIWNSNDKILQFKIKLEKLGFKVSNQPNQDFGSKTEQVVKAFQQYYNLRVNGIGDPVTLQRLDEILKNSLQVGDSHKNLINIKNDLARAGFKISNHPNSDFGPKTEEEVKAFQEYYGLRVNGLLDDVTLITLERVVNNELTRNVPLLVNGAQTYSYQDLQGDINDFNFYYPNLVKTVNIGRSVDGRNIYAMKLGNGNKEIFINGSHHAREHMTTNIIMKMIDEYAKAYVGNKRFSGYNVRKLLNEFSIWFVPMVNPDGVMLVQDGAYSAKSPQRVISINNGSRDFSAWKANIRGVDLNRQYPYLWNTITDNLSSPGYAFYKGRAPLTEPEVQAVYDFTNDHNFLAAVAYHSSGQLIYTRYGFTPHTRNITKGVQRITGYTPIDLQNSVSGGGYTDWFLADKRKPAITIEISQYVGERPVPLGNWDSIWSKQRSIGLYLLDYADENL